MAISEDWLRCPTDPEEVEADLAELGAPDLWYRAWREMLGRLAPGDELWEYWSMEETARESEPAEDIPGFTRVREEEIPSLIGEPADRSFEFREGFALVRDGEIIDWVEGLPWIP